MTILYGSGLSNSSRHSGSNLPLLLLGGGAGRLDGGRHLHYANEPSTADLLLTLMDKLDVPVERIGGSTGQAPARCAAGSVRPPCEASSRCWPFCSPPPARPRRSAAAGRRGPQHRHCGAAGAAGGRRTARRGRRGRHHRPALASYRNDLEGADLLLGAGADVNAATDLGVTPLWLAAENASRAMVRRLLAAGADANRSLLLGETPAMVAARAGNADVLEQLLAAGADPEARGARGQTALMWAAAGTGRPPWRCCSPTEQTCTPAPTSGAR